MSTCHASQRGDRTSRNRPEGAEEPPRGGTGSLDTRSDYADQTTRPVPSPPVRTWLSSTPPAARNDDPLQRWLVTTEVLVVLTVSLGL